MKKIFLALISIVAGVVVSVFTLAGSAGSARETRIIKPQPVEEGVDRRSATEAHYYLYSCFPSDENGRPVFPDTFGGNYFPGEGDDKLAIQLTVSDPSEYLFVQEEFPCVVFEQVRYSYNYLDELIHEYLTTFNRESETVYGGEIDVRNNRAVIFVDEETLSRKTNGSDSPIEFRLGSSYDDFLDYGSVPDDSSFVPYGIKTPVEKLSENEVYDIFNAFANSQDSDSINIRGGEQLENRGLLGKSFKFYLTAGIGCTTPEGKNGLVVNGHEMNLYDFIYLNDIPIGFVSFVQFGTGDGYGDYSIITLADSVTANGETHYISNALRVNHSVYHPKKGDKLFKCSQHRGYADLTVTEVDVKKTPLVDGEYIDVYGLVKAKVTLGDAGRGDSGAGVYHNKNDNPLSFLEFSGIIHGGEHENGELIAYFTPPKYIKNCTIVCV